MKIKNLYVLFFIFSVILFTGCHEKDELIITLDNVPDFADKPYVTINGNIPEFSNYELIAESYESYGKLDELGRCSAASACIGRDLMPTKPRGSISQVKPSGWHTQQYDIVDGRYLYNRCHLIGWQLTAENANENNLITGTRYMNNEGMLPFENMVADYIKETNNHVMYRVTPIYVGSNLVASGVNIEAMSVEDKGEGICFNVYCYNNQPGIEIDYSTGVSWLEGEKPPINTSDDETVYIINISSKKFHLSSCKLADDIKKANRREYTGSREELISQGYYPCKNCNP